MKSIKRIMAVLLSVVTICSILPVNTFASVWRTGDFSQYASNWTSSHTVTAKNKNNYTYVTIYTYKCDRGAGHSGACKNSRRVNGVYYVQCKSTGGWNNLIGNGVSQIGLPGVNSFQIRLRLSSNNQFQHWALEGNSNVKAIS